MWVFLSLSDDSESVETQKEGKEKKRGERIGVAGRIKTQAFVAREKNIAMAGSALVTGHLMLNSVQWSRSARELHFVGLKRQSLVLYYINCSYIHSMLW